MEEEMEEPQNLEFEGLDIDAALAEPEAHVRRDRADDHERSLEGHAPTLLRGPIRPSAEDVERHDATHVPYRNWCPICVAARGQQASHKRQLEASRKRRKVRLPKFCLDT